MIKYAGIWNLVLALFWAGVMGSCTDQPGTSQNKDQLAAAGKPRYMPKPRSHFQDTIWIEGPAAVFFYPDSFQLSIVQAGLDTMVYKGIMHDYHYQMHYCHGFLLSEWAGIQIKEARNCRYLIFSGYRQTRQCIDLDAIPDLYGLFVSNGSREPIQVDMTNVRTEVSTYLPRSKG